MAATRAINVSLIVRRDKLTNQTVSRNHNLFEVGLWYSRGRIKVKAGTTAQHPTVAVPYEYFLWFEGSHKRIHNNNNNIPLLFAEKFLITV